MWNAKTLSMLVLLGVTGTALGMLPHPGDWNNDGSVDVGDLGILAFNWLRSPDDPGIPPLPGEPVLDVAYLGVLAFNWGWQGTPAGPGCPPPTEATDDVSVQPLAIYPDDPWPGDANNDGFVDVGDLGIICFNWWQPTDPPPVWAMGNFNGDGAVDIGDLGILAFNWNWQGAPAQIASVPEPFSIVLVGVGALALLRRRG